MSSDFLFCTPHSLIDKIADEIEDVQVRGAEVCFCCVEEGRVQLFATVVFGWNQVQVFATAGLVAGGQLGQC